MKKKLISFINGISYIGYPHEFDLKKSSSNYEKDDLEALKKDWEKVGTDLRTAIKTYNGG